MIRSGLARLGVLALFAAAMGWLEAVVVVYLRALLGIAHASSYPSDAEMLARMNQLPWLLPTEQTREVATILMLAAVAWLAAPRIRGRVGAFLMAFGVWDVAYYGALRVLVDWPPRLSTMDLLFLIPPHPWWYQPVWVPVAISGAMVMVGAWLFLADRGAPARPKARRAPAPPGQ